MFFFFKQKTAYEMRISDWSSDVCSSDLPSIGHDFAGHDADSAGASHQSGRGSGDHGRARLRLLQHLRPSASARPMSNTAVLENALLPLSPDRKSVVQGKSVSVRVDLGGRRIIKKTSTLRYNCIQQM